MECPHVILPLPLTKISFQHRHAEFSNVTLLITHETEITDDVVKHNLTEHQSALQYGCICLNIDEIGSFLQRIDRTHLRTCFTIFIKARDFDPHHWRLENHFAEIHYNHHQTTITRSRIVDADQAHADYGYLSTKIGRQLYRKYLETYQKYYEDEKWSAETRQHQQILSANPTAPEYRPQVHHNINVQPKRPEIIELKPIPSVHTSYTLPSSSNPPSYSEMETLETVIRTEDRPIETDINELYSPILHRHDRNRSESSWLRRLCCWSSEAMEMGRVRLPRYDDVLYKGMRKRILKDNALTGIEILCRGGRVKDNIGKKPFYVRDEIEDAATPFELCEYIATQWDVDIEILMPLIHYTARSSDLTFAQLLADEIRRIRVIGKNMAKRNQRYSILIGKRCSGCAYDQLSQTQKLHYHSEFLDRLHGLDAIVFQRFTLLAFEIMKIPLNIQKDRNVLELELF